MTATWVRYSSKRVELRSTISGRDVFTTQTYGVVTLVKDGWKARVYAPLIEVTKRRKADAMEFVEWHFIERSVSKMKPANIDLSNAVWSDDTVGNTAYHILRKGSPPESTRRSYASIWKQRGVYHAAIAGYGPVNMAHVSTLEEAEAVVIALIKMGG